MSKICDRCNCVFSPTNISATTATVRCPNCNTLSCLPDALPQPPLTTLPSSSQSDFIPYDHDFGLLNEDDDDDDVIELDSTEDDEDSYSFTQEDYDFLEDDEDFYTTVDRTSEADHYESRPTPAATSFINDLDANKVAVTDLVLKQDLNKELSCVICSDEFQMKESVNKMSCGHWFHSECIVKWLNLKNTCPLCRYEFPVEPDSDHLLLSSEESPTAATTLERDTDHLLRSLPEESPTSATTLEEALENYFAIMRIIDMLERQADTIP